MTASELAKTAAEFLHASGRGDADAVTPLITDDFHFQFMQRGASWSSEGQENPARMGREDFLTQGMKICNAITRDGMRFTVEEILVDAPWVALFGYSDAVSLKGKPYHNHYCWRMLFIDGKVQEFREYCDTHHAHEVLFG